MRMRACVRALLLEEKGHLRDFIDIVENEGEAVCGALPEVPCNIETA